jgi:flavin-dependent thymidylate synthase
MALMYKGIVVRDLADITDEQRREMFDQIQQTKLKAPFEAVQLHWMVEGVTRSLTHQMVRQRTAVFAQESLRFAVVEDGFAERVALPPSLAGSRELADIQVDVDLGDYDRLSDLDKMRFQWDRSTLSTQVAYTDLVNMGMPAEDARGLLPHNITTRLNYVTNLRNFQEHGGSRLCTQAQFEWRAVWIAFVQELRAYGANQTYRVRESSLPGSRVIGAPSSWQFDLIADMFRPACYLTGKCEFAAMDLDRKCKIRSRVDDNAQHGRPSSLWHKDLTVGEMVGDGPDLTAQQVAEVVVPSIDPREWLADPGAAR